MMNNIHFRRLGRNTCHETSQNAVCTNDQSGREGTRKRVRTQFGVGEKPEGASWGATFDEAEDVDPKLHVIWPRARVLVEKEGKEDPGI